MTCRFDVFIYCNMIAIVAIVNTAIMLHDYHFFFVVRIITI